MLWAGAAAGSEDRADDRRDAHVHPRMYVRGPVMYVRGLMMFVRGSMIYVTGPMMYERGPLMSVRVWTGAAAGGEDRADDCR